MSRGSMYDVVVLGAGAAGCAAARSLALSDPRLSVCLVESGPRAPPPLAMRVPLLAPLVSRLPSCRSFLREYHCVAAPALGGRRLRLLRGRGLGGTSNVNDMRYLRGAASDFAAWGDPAWTFERILPYFTALERNARGACAHHGDNGPLAVSDAPRGNIDSELNVRWFEACEALGIPAAEDFNAGVCDGFSAFQSLVARGVRVDVFDALLEAERHRMPNLRVLSDTRAMRLVFSTSGSCRRFIGVEVSGEELLRADRAVVCLGAVESPLLLLHSGVGPRGEIADVPDVGRNLIQSCSATVVFSTSHVRSKALSWRNAPHLFRAWREYGADRTGPFASLAEAAAFVRGAAAAAAPDLSLVLAPFAPRPHDGFAVRVTHHYPAARGEVRPGEEAKGKDKGEEAKGVKGAKGKGEEAKGAKGGGGAVVTGLLGARADVERMDEGLRWVGSLCSRDATARSAFRRDAAGRPAAPFAELDVRLRHPREGLATQRAAAAFLAQYAECGGDLFGTCAMGTVVDSALRVRGVEGVRVADASVVPVPTCGSSTVIGAAIGARVASLMEEHP